MSQLTQQFYEMIASKFFELERQKNPKLQQADAVCAVWEKYQRGEITAQQCDELIAKAVKNDGAPGGAG